MYSAALRPLPAHACVCAAGVVGACVLGQGIMRTPPPPHEFFRVRLPETAIDVAAASMRAAGDFVGMVRIPCVTVTVTVVKCVWMYTVEYTGSVTCLVCGCMIILLRDTPC